MKRLNPSTGKPFKWGETREDGFLFYKYNLNKPIKKDGYFRESWLSPISFYKTRKDAIERSFAWDNRNKEKIQKRHSLWLKNNPDKSAAKTAKRRASKLQRTPSWLTHKHLQQIESVYALAKQLTAETGIVHHVDHIVPLQGETVSGLHVPWNLRAIPATENLHKSNCHD